MHKEELSLLVGYRPTSVIFVLNGGANDRIGRLVQDRAPVFALAALGGKSGRQEQKGQKYDEKCLLVHDCILNFDTTDGSAGGASVTLSESYRCCVHQPPYTVVFGCVGSLFRNCNAICVG